MRGSAFREDERLLEHEHDAELRHWLVTEGEHESLLLVLGGHKLRAVDYLGLISTLLDKVAPHQKGGRLGLVRPFQECVLLDGA